MPLTVSIHALRLAAFSLPLTLAATASQAQFGNVSDLPSSRYQASPPSPDKQPPLVDPHAPLDAEPQWDGDKPFNPDLHAPQFPAPPMPQEMLDGFRPAAMAAFDLTDTSVQFAPVIQHHGDTLVQASIGGATRIIRLQLHSMRAEGARLVIDRGAGVLVEEAWPAPATYRGIVEGMPGLQVAASIRDGEVSMLLHSTDPQQPSWIVQPLRDAVPGMPPRLHVVYRDVDVIARNAHCGWDAANPAPELIEVAQRGTSCQLYSSEFGNRCPSTFRRTFPRRRAWMAQPADRVMRAGSLAMTAHWRSRTSAARSVSTPMSSSTRPMVHPCSTRSTTWN